MKILQAGDQKNLIETKAEGGDAQQGQKFAPLRPTPAAGQGERNQGNEASDNHARQIEGFWWQVLHADLDGDWVNPPLCRSEERRVGKECRSRWSPYH